MSFFLFYVASFLVSFIIIEFCTSLVDLKLTVRSSANKQFRTMKKYFEDKPELLKELENTYSNKK